MAQKQNILNLWKLIGETPLERLNRFREANPEYRDIPMTYAGRLDPMAEGVLLVLVGDSKHKEDLLNLDKEYEFDCLWGIETDTYDILGMIGKTTFRIPNVEDIERTIGKFLGKRSQVYPAYSSKTVDGKQLFEWAREGRIGEIEIPKRDIQIYTLEILSQKTISGKAIMKVVEEKISKVKGDFRQEEILKLWDETLKNEEETNFLITKMKACVSSGTYIRSLTHEMGRELKCGALAFGITRTRVGKYSSKNSLP